MLPLHQVETFLAPAPARFQDIVLELRNLVFRAAPDAVEVIRWGALAYFHAGGGGIVSAGICQIGIQADHVRLAFIHGAFLPDPEGLLQGDRKAKRYICLTDFEQAPWQALNGLISASARFDPRSLAR
jgi:hypothetical protein